VKALKVPLLVFGAVLAAILVAGLGIVYTGAFNIAADNPHWGITSRLIETTRERSITVRARSVAAPPSLEDAQLIAMGAEHYAEMCTGCHLAPGMKDTEIRTGLYPKPPNLVEHGAHRKPAEMFWIIKHGLKMTGMPAWGVTHDDQSIWGMVALLQKLPELSQQQYEELAAQGRAAGHTHGGEESGHSHEGGHSHDGASEEGAEGHSHGEDGHEHGATGGDTKSGAESKPPAHEHSDGHSHGDSHTATTEPTRAAVPAAAAEPVAVVDRFFRELAAGNAAGASALLDSGVLIFESGGAERSRAEYASHHLASDAKFLGSATHRLMSRTGDAVGDLAWVASEASLSGSMQKKSVDVISTETMVLRKTQAGWRIVHIHWSNRPAKRPA